MNNCLLVGDQEWNYYIYSDKIASTTSDKDHKLNRLLMTITFKTSSKMREMIKQLAKGVNVTVNNDIYTFKITSIEEVEDGIKVSAYIPFGEVM